MAYLHQVLAEQVNNWRHAGHPSDSFPAIAEILQYAIDDEIEGNLRFLRRAQFHALETYWYLRLVENTPRIPALYEQLFTKSSERRTAMGLNQDAIREYIEDEGWEALTDRIITDNAFVRQYHLESLRETLTLDYPSYIFALAMGAGKTILIGVIIATEFAMAQEYPDGPFVQNALVFAPGKTIIESLRELADIPFEKVLPARMYKPFAASLKLTFTRDGDETLSGVVWGSNWNVIVTNTEKIRIQKSNRGRTPQIPLGLEKTDHEAEIANLRLQAIASLPHLAVFSDEAHHTYGQKLLGKWEKDNESGEMIFKEQGIKKVRRTVDFLAQETNLVVVINTTGTPYFERQPLRDVVVWYGLGEGIKDGILKEVANNIQIFDLDDAASEELVRYVVEDFIKDYWSVKLPDGSPARMALYFPNTTVQDELRPMVESVLTQHGLDTSTVITVHGDSTKEIRQEFNRIATDPDAPYRFILLVNIGTEGWNCPSLYACALVRRLRSSNNFVLQAATRCLRQVPGNDQPARIYVSKGNKSLLAKQLEETYGTSLQELSSQQTERVEKLIVLHKPQLPRLLIRKKLLRYKPKPSLENKPLVFTKPDIEYRPEGTVQTFTIAEPKSGGVRLVRLEGVEDQIEFEPVIYTAYGAAAELSAQYHLSMSEVITALYNAYDDLDHIPEFHLPELGKQVEQQRCEYEEDWEEIDVALALVKPEGFDQSYRQGVPVYTARISFAKDREHLYKTVDDLPDNTVAGDFSFHYEGYNFDSVPEFEYLERVLSLLKQHPEQIEGIWFTGGLTDPGKTELYAEYLGEDNRWHRYTPDFVIRRKDGKHLVVEIKSDREKAEIDRDMQRYQQGEAPISAEGRKSVALKRWEELNPDVLHYEVIFAGDSLAVNSLDRTRDFISTR